MINIWNATDLTCNWCAAKNVASCTPLHEFKKCDFIALISSPNKFHTLYYFYALQVHRGIWRDIKHVEQLPGLPGGSHTHCCQLHVKMDFRKYFSSFLKRGSLRCILFNVQDWFREMFASLAKCMWTVTKNVCIWVANRTSNSFPINSHPYPIPKSFPLQKSHPVMCFVVRSVHYVTYTDNNTHTYPTDDVPLNTSHSSSHN